MTSFVARWPGSSMLTLSLLIHRGEREGIDLGRSTLADWVGKATALSTALTAEGPRIYYT